MSPPPFISSLPENATCTNPSKNAYNASKNAPCTFFFHSLVNPNSLFLVLELLNGFPEEFKVEVEEEEVEEEEERRD